MSGAANKAPPNGAAQPQGFSNAKTLLQPEIDSFGNGIMDGPSVMARAEEVAKMCGVRPGDLRKWAKQQMDKLQAKSGGSGQTKPTEDSIALKFTEIAKKYLRFDCARGKWAIWINDHWKFDNTNYGFDYARRVVRNLSHKNPEDRALTKIRTASEVERAARSDRAMAVEGDVWDTDDWVLGVPGGMVDLRTGQTKPPDATKLMTKRTLVAPADPGTPYPIWSKFLDEATGGDVSLIGFLQSVCGYCLTGDMTEEAIFFFWGSGGNGKGVFRRTQTAIMGDYATAAAMATFTASKHDAHPTDVARLQGARLVTASETEQGRSWAVARIKEITGNEGKITARFLHRDNFEFIPKCKLLLGGNHKPRLNAADEGFGRRLNLIPFICKPATVNHQLKEQLIEEYPAILRWMIDGCLIWQQKRLQPPPVVRDATKEYFDDENTFRDWVRADLFLDPKVTTASVILFGKWVTWCENNNEDPGTNRGFADRVIQELPACRRGAKGNKGVTIEGVALTPPPPTSRVPGIPDNE